MPKVRRSMQMVGATVMAVAALGSGTAAARPPEVETFSDPFGADFSCDGFKAHYEGHDRGRITNFYDNAGNLVRQVGHVHAVETDTNLATGASVEVKTNITLNGDLLPDGSYGTYAITGEFNVGTTPGRGIVVHDTGRVEFDENGDPVVFRGVHETFGDEDPFCAALG